jgi:pimeloyl-ACP methyl ester carboxylesterase
MPFARVNGNMIFYREVGEGPVALFIHGFPLDHSLWLDQLKGLAHVRRCVALDLRGFGRSDPVVDHTLTMEMLADDAAGLLDALGAETADIVALSMGGYVALALYELQPRLVRTLTLIDTRAAADSREGRQARDAMAGRLLDWGRHALATEMIGSLLGRVPSPRAQARLRSMVEGTRYETFVAALAGMKERPDRTSLLARIEVPTLVVGGDEDTLIPPKEVRELAKAIPGARTTVIAGAGHLPPIERPDQVNEALIELFEGRKVVWWGKGSSST